MRTVSLLCLLFAFLSPWSLLGALAIPTPHDSDLHRRAGGGAISDVPIRLDRGTGIAKESAIEVKHLSIPAIARKGYYLIKNTNPQNVNLVAMTTPLDKDELALMSFHNMKDRTSVLEHMKRPRQGLQNQFLFTLDFIDEISKHSQVKEFSKTEFYYQYTLQMLSLKADGDGNLIGKDLEERYKELLCQTLEEAVEKKIPWEKVKEWLKVDPRVEQKVQKILGPNWPFRSAEEQTALLLTAIRHGLYC